MKMHARKSLRVLAADDSTVMREVLRMVFAMHASAGDATLPPMELLGVMRDGIEALEAVRTMRPDVLLLDLEMPRLNGLGVLEQLRTVNSSLPVIMCSAHTERGARATLDALAAGAKDYVMKPAQSRDFAAALDALIKQLLPKIAALAGPERAPAGTRNAGPGLRAAAGSDLATDAGTPVDIVVIGVSTGGPSALETMLPALSRSLPVPVMIVQHMPKLFTGALADRLNGLCALPVVQATDGMTVRRSAVYLAPGDAHMEVARGAGEGLAVRLHQGPARNSCKPSVDYLFESAARVFGAGTLALVLTGMGQGGLDGARAVKSAGGTVLAQDQETSAVWGMPGRVVREGVAAAALPLSEIAASVTRRVQGSRAVPAGAMAEGTAVDNRARREVSYGMHG